MLMSNSYEIVIEGITHKGKPFRPSDWAERLCGVLSSFDQDHRLSYHQWVRPILVDNVRCVTIDQQLKQISPDMFNFLMDFARDNDLRIVNGKSSPVTDYGLPPIRSNKVVAQQADDVLAVESSISERQATLNTQLRELAPTEIDTAFAALHSLHHNIRDLTQFQDLVHTQQMVGYRLLGIFEEGKQNAVAVCGFRICTNFAFGCYLQIDDLFIGHDHQNHYYANQLLATIQSIAQASHCSSIHVCMNHKDTLIQDLYLAHHFVPHGQHLSYQLHQL